MPEVSEPVACPPVRLCPSDALADKGKAWLFRVRYFREEVSAFVLRVDGQVVGYLNRCAHVPAEMDWQPGEFWDSGRDFLICSIHGASYSPTTGRCVGGPCGRRALTRLDVAEQDGHVYWYPSRDIVPLVDSSS